MLDQDLAIKELNDGFKVVDLVEYEITNVRINNKSKLNEEKTLDYDIVYDIKFKDRDGAYNNLSIKIKEDGEGKVDLIQNYTKLKFFFDKDMAESFFKETKEKILKSLTN
jgi:sucrose-6-phosphate hydrolase SacC (GH32 family)